jgi:uracil-DNA glycosylase
MIKTPTQVNASCKRCKLHQYAHPKAIGLRGLNSLGPRKLVIFTDYPDYFADHAHAPYKLDVKELLFELLSRMSVAPEDVGFEYTLRCYPAKSLPGTKAERAGCIEECAAYRFNAILRTRPKALVALGKVSMEAFTGRSELKNSEGRKFANWEPIVREVVPEVWVGYSINYLLVSPSDTPRVFRVLYKAAEDAGLHPKINPKPFKFKWKNLL